MISLSHQPAGQAWDKARQGSGKMIIESEPELSIRKEKSNLEKMLKIFFQIALSR
jgi:hypothetical protein